MTDRKPAPPLSPVEMMRVVEFRIHDGDERESNHRCGKCWGPYGKSRIPCPNEFPEIGIRAARVAAYKAQREGASDDHEY